MGVTLQSIKTIKNVLEQFPNIKSVLDFGNQNLYIDKPDENNQYPFVKDWYIQRGMIYLAIDLSGENGSLKLDLSTPLDKEFIAGKGFDLVCNHGTIEHIYNMYEGFRNAHNFTKAGGIMIHESPLIGNWPGHGFHYVDKKFFEELAYINGYKIIELKLEAAMNNEIDGWNVIAVMQKEKDSEFCSKEQFPEHQTITDLSYERSQEWIWGSQK